MNFTNKVITVNGVATTFVPHEITTSGSFVWKEEGVRSFKALRFVVTPTPSRDGKVLDRVSVSVHAPVLAQCETSCGTSEEVAYVELLKADYRFSPETSGDANRKRANDLFNGIQADVDFLPLVLDGALIIR